VKIVVVGNGRSVHVTGRSAAVAARGHQVRLVTLGPVLPTPGLEVRTRPIPTSVWQATRAAQGFLSDIRSFQPDLLQLHYAGGKLGTMASVAGVRPFVVTVMGGDVLPEQHVGGMPRLERRATRRILHQADRILVKSDALRSALDAFGGLSTKADTVRWGVDTSSFGRDLAGAAALRERLGLRGSDRVIVSPRILAPLYNIHLAVEAMPFVLRRAASTVLLLTEYNVDETYRRTLLSRVEVLGLRDRVRFIGRLEHSEMPSLYSLADVVLSIPASDGLPQSLFEAMACGTPVVLGRLPAYAEVVTDGTSALLTDLTPEAIGATVSKLLDDVGLREAIAGAARARVAQVASLSASVDRVLAIYEEAVARRPREPPPTQGRFLDLLSLLLR